AAHYPRYAMRAITITCALLLAAAGCGEERAEPSTPEPAPTEAPSPEPPAPEPPAADPNEACAQVIVVAWQGAASAAPTITRSEAEARAKAEELRRRLDAGEDFAT